MKRKYMILAALAICLMPAFASADYRGHRHGGYGHYGRHHHGRSHSGFSFSFGYSNYGHGHRGYGFGSNFGYGRYYDRPHYYRARSYYVPVVTRYYDEPCYDYGYRPRVYSRTYYYYDRPARPYYPRRYYRYCD
jgi:hypothetical protein